MTTKRLVSLECVLAMGLGAVFLLPKEIKLEPAAITAQLPNTVGHWVGKDEPISEGERGILGPDTQFARKLYVNGAGDEIFASIVFSGPDMNTSIHRPERCLPAQGWTVADTRTVVLPTDKGAVRATRLHNIRNVHANNAQSVTVNSLNYYWFVGHSDVTESHFQRTYIDIRDRVLHGRNQQWAYVTIAATVTDNIKVAGRNAAETDELIQDFIRELVPQLQAHQAE
jgi:EpsI family protein